MSSFKRRGGTEGGGTIGKNAMSPPAYRRQRGVEDKIGVAKTMVHGKSRRKKK